MPGLSRRGAHALLDRFGSPEAIFAQPLEGLAALCGWPLARALAGAPSPEAEADLARARALGLRVLTPDGPDFPPLLRMIPDPPLTLYLRGRLPPQPSLSIVGSRRATARGRELARSLAAAIASAGATVVSGLAYGIDRAAHEGALEAGGRTLAVLAGGLDRPGPRGNRALAERILAEGGGWLSEHPPGRASLPRHFPERNRLISGHSPQTLVVEARARSGSLWTAAHALEQGREVLAVPGPVDRSDCRGTNALIRDGATVILDAGELLGHVLPGRAGKQSGAGNDAQPPAEGIRGELLRRLDEGPQEPDELARTLGLTPARLSGLLTELEIEGRIVRTGARVVRRPAEGRG